MASLPVQNASNRHAIQQLRRLFKAVCLSGKSTTYSSYLSPLPTARCCAPTVTPQAFASPNATLPPKRQLQQTNPLVYLGIYQGVNVPVQFFYYFADRNLPRWMTRRRRVLARQVTHVLTTAWLSAVSHPGLS